MINYLPKKIQEALSLYDSDCIYEIRLRTNYPIKINYNGNYIKLKDSTKEDIISTKNDIDFIILNVTENSIYAFNEQIVNGYIAGKNGARIGIAGECVVENNKIITIKNISSLNIRIPHFIYGCSNFIYNEILNKGLHNTLIISSPFMGKTTILKDLAINLNNTNKYNILLIDERGEFVDVKGENLDKISFLSKEKTFEMGLRTMSPNVIIMDELSTENDWYFTKKAINSGVYIIASIHAHNEMELQCKPYFTNNIFDRYVVLENYGPKGVVKKLLNKDFNEL